MSRDLWNGLSASARKRLVQRDYKEGDAAPFSALQLADLDQSQPEIQRIWIPGVEIFRRHVSPQRFRGSFSELARQNEGVCARVGVWPRQWSMAEMFSGTAKGFHIHPPFVPEGEKPEKWFQRLYAETPGDVSLRPYEKEQWDLMFPLRGTCEMILIDERAGLERRMMRFFMSAGGPDGADSSGVLIPAGVAHALRVDGSTDLMMVYGTSVTFHAEFEGRIAAGVERHDLPPEWLDYVK